MTQSERHLSHEVRTLPLLERYRRPVDAYMQGLLQTTPGIPARMVEYHLGFRGQDGQEIPGAKSGGKALRPTLTLLTADATSGKWRDAVPAAAAIELFHNFTLIHDDIQDGDKTRHGKPTVWTLWGEGQAINAGDAAHLLSTKALLDLQRKGYSAEQVAKAVEILTKTGLLLAEGQAMDMSFEERQDVTVEDYKKMIRGKTGVLLENAIGIGALLGGADKETTNHLRAYGKEMGRAFQIVDDALGIWGDPEKTGKPVGADIRRRKKSYPIALAFDRATGSKRRQLEARYNDNRELTDIEVGEVLHILDELNCREQVEREVPVTLEKAITAVDQTKIDSVFKKDYQDLAHLCAKRQF